MNTVLDLGYFPSAKQKTAHEWAAFCPSCNDGEDRFIILTNRPKGGAYFCRQCEAKGDGIAYLMNFEGMTYPEACKALGLPLQGKKSIVHKKTTGKAAPQQKFSPLPCETWRNAAADFVAQCSRNLGHPEAVAALKDRGLTTATAAALGIGWNERDRYELCTAWGLEEVEGRNKIRLPKGLVYPTRRKVGIVAVTIRQPQAQPKYWQVRGSQNVPYVVGQAHMPLFLFEGALDAVLLLHEMQGQCAAVALGGSTKNADEATAAFINAAPLVVAVPDDDEAGHKAWSEWRKLFPSAVCVHTLGAKDLTDMHRASKYDHTIPSVKQWADVALQIASQKQKTPNPTQGMGQGISELTSNTTLSTEREEIDLNSMRLAEICADPDLVKLYREQHPFNAAEVREDISCPKMYFAWRSKKDCLDCVGDAHCFMPILDNPFEVTL